MRALFYLLGKEELREREREKEREREREREGKDGERVGGLLALQLRHGLLQQNLTQVGKQGTWKDLSSMNKIGQMFQVLDF